MPPDLATIQFLCVCWRIKILFLFIDVSSPTSSDSPLLFPYETIWVKSSPGLSANKMMYVCFPVFICVSSVTNQVQNILILYFAPFYTRPFVHFLTIVYKTSTSVRPLNLKFYCSHPGDSGGTVNYTPALTTAECLSNFVIETASPM